ncbi:MAG TPA: hypothetical protein VJX10_20855 [Pseudonocardiaceae bacterium]|nr:hypothetical protein [Pseudonocardiaceae bacterium]
MAANERLTALTGGVLLVLFAVEIITVVPLRSLLSIHFFVGVLLMGPLAVKVASTGWRFARYYTRHPAYRRKGPPDPVSRRLAPVLLAATLAVVGSGIALAATGPAAPIPLRIHVVSFLVWLVVGAVHVVVYVRRVPALIADDWRTAPPVPVTGRRGRLAVNVAALVAAAGAAALLLPTVAAWTAWLNQGVAGPGIVGVVVIAATAAVILRRRRAAQQMSPPPP